MYIKKLKSKIHRARVTEAELDYVGSLTIDKDLMDIAGLVKFEKVLVANISNGNRFETYVIEGARQSRTFCLNGATAHLGAVGDSLTIFAFCDVTPEEEKELLPQIVVLDEKNNVLELIGGENGE